MSFSYETPEYLDPTALPTLEGGTLAHVAGRVNLQEGNMTRNRAFSQTFLLLPGGDLGFYILNNIIQVLPPDQATFEKEAQQGNM